MNQSEIGVMCLVNILEIFSKCSKSLQNPSIELSSAIALMKGLHKFLNMFHDQFENIIERVWNWLVATRTHLINGEHGHQQDHSMTMENK